MSSRDPAGHVCPVPSRAHFPFFVGAFGIAWGAFAAFLLAPETLERLFGPPSSSHPLFFLAVYAPGLTAFTIVLAYGGRAGFARYLSRLALWRAPLGWWAVLLAGIPAVFMAGAALKGVPLVPDLPGIWQVLGFMAFMALLGPMEEFGWRGLALPLMQRHLAPIWAGLVLGLIWGLWHLPAFLLSGLPQSGWSFMPFFIGATAVGVILTPLFNASGGSMLLAMLYHFQLNNPLWPDAQPFDTPLFVALAVAVVWLNRKTMFTREGAATDVIPPRRISG